MFMVSHLLRKWILPLVVADIICKLVRLKSWIFWLGSIVDVTKTTIVLTYWKDVIFVRTTVKRIDIFYALFDWIVSIQVRTCLSW